MYVLIVSVIGYFFGCIHGSQIVGKYKNINIKETGIKNSGATNTTIILGWKYGFIVAFIDVFKAILSILLVLFILNKSGIINEAQMFLVYINALFIIIGHNYPLTSSFSGGKGTASFIGLLLVIDWKIAIMGIGILLLFALVADYMVIGVFFMYVSFLGYTQYSFGFAPGLVAFLLLILSVIKHMENYKRIAKQEEIRLSSIFQKDAG